MPDFHVHINVILQVAVIKMQTVYRERMRKRKAEAEKIKQKEMEEQQEAAARIRVFDLIRTFSIETPFSTLILLIFTTSMPLKTH